MCTCVGELAIGFLNESDSVRKGDQRKMVCYLTCRVVTVKANFELLYSKSLCIMTCTELLVDIGCGVFNGPQFT